MALYFPERVHTLKYYTSINIPSMTKSISTNGFLPSLLASNHLSMLLIIIIVMGNVWSNITSKILLWMKYKLYHGNISNLIRDPWLKNLSRILMLFANLSEEVFLFICTRDILWSIQFSKSSRQKRHCYNFEIYSVVLFVCFKTFCDKFINYT